MLLILIIFFLISKTASERIFEVDGIDQRIIIIPMFSEASNFMDFMDCIEAYMALPRYISTVEFHEADGGKFQISLKDPGFDEALENIFELLNVNENFSEKDLRMTYPCSLYESCQPERYSIIIMTDFSNFTNFFNPKFFQQHFYFIFHKSDECETGVEPIFDEATSKTYNMITCYDMKDTEVANRIAYEIRSGIVFYKFNPTQASNFFIFANRSIYSELQYFTSILRKYIYNFNDNLFAPSLYADITQINGTHGLENDRYELIKCGLSTHSNPTYNPYSTKFIEDYLTKIYDPKVIQSEHQWNVILTDEFPLWLKNINISLEAPLKHLDIYLYAGNDSDKYYGFLRDIKNHLADILPNDGSASLRLNHVLIIRGFNELIDWPTGHEHMQPKWVDYQGLKHWYIWGAPTIVVTLVAATAIIAFILWKRRVNRLLEEKYSWAIKAGFTPCEAENFIEAGKDLFVPETSLKVDFEDIKGKGNSAIIYGGRLSDTSPIAIIHPGFETQRYSNCLVAIKILNKYGKDNYEEIFREVDAALKLRWHRHICCLLGWSIYQATPVLIYEAIDGQNLLIWAKKYPKMTPLIPEKIIAMILWQIANGMEYIINQKIIHKDLAARNVLLTRTLEAKITDFGLASFCEKTLIYQGSSQRRLPYRWMSPEALTQWSFSEASDIWSFGVVTWELFARGAIPYGNIDGNKILQSLMTGKRLEIPKGVSVAWKKLVKNCWKLNPAKRSNFRTIKDEVTMFLDEATRIKYGYVDCINESCGLQLKS